MKKSVLYVIIPKVSRGVKDEDLERCKRSVEMQQTGDWEIIPLIEEGDSYPKIYNQALEKIALEKIRCGYIWFVYPWMVLKEGICEWLLSAYEKEPQDMLVLGYEKVSWNTVHEHLLLQRRLDAAEMAKEYLVHSEDEMYVSLWNKLFRAEIIRENGIVFDEDLREGYEACFLFWYLQFCEKISVSEMLCCQFFERKSKQPGAYERINEKEKVFLQYRLYEFKKNQGVACGQVDKYWQDYLVYEYARLGEITDGSRGLVRSLLNRKKVIIAGSRLKNNIYIYQKLFRTVLSPNRIKKNLYQKKQLKRMKSARKNERQFEQRLRFFRGIDKKFAMRLRKKKHVLLFCESKTMFPHIWDYYECLRDYENIRLFIYYPGDWNWQVKEGVSLVKSEIYAWYKYWDMIVCADASVPLKADKDETKLMYINHGLHMISYDKGESLYAYAKGYGVSEQGEPCFTAMLEPNSRYAHMLVEENPLLKGHVFHTGYKYAEKIRDTIGNYQAYREQFGFQKDEIVVAVFGSWGPDSLFHTVGESLVKQAKELLSEGYRFILSIHPKEYENYDPNIEALGFKMEALKEHGFVIRNPKDSSVPYMNAADVVICDYSTLCEEAMLAEKRIILSKFPKERVWKHSTIADYQKKGLVFGAGDDLKKLLRVCMEDTEYAQLCKKYALELYPPEGGYQHTVYELTRQLLESR